MLADTWTSRTFGRLRNVERIEQEPDRNQAEAGRKLPEGNRAEIESGPPTTVKACLTRSQKSTTCPWIQMPTAAATRSVASRSCPQRMIEEPRKSKLGRSGRSPT
jgi:hypothetical protein